VAVVAIHQPNYLPWLGYFRKIAAADVFVFLDDVQFSKNSYTNRVQILAEGAPRWLTVPISAHLGDPINRVWPARKDWPRAHLDTLYGRYRTAPAFRTVWSTIGTFFESLPDADVATINRHLVAKLAEALGLSCRFVCASTIPTGSATGDDRLVELVASIAQDACYLSGKGGANYQDPEKFSRAGLGFRYLEFVHPRYDQDIGDNFVQGLSVVDAVFRLGWDRTAALVAGTLDAA
jgi:hypothetical protein